MAGKLNDLMSGWVREGENTIIQDWIIRLRDVLILGLTDMFGKVMMHSVLFVIFEKMNAL